MKIYSLSLYIYSKRETFFLLPAPIQSSILTKLINNSDQVRSNVVTLPNLLDSLTRDSEGGHLLLNRDLDPFCTDLVFFLKEIISACQLKD